MSIYADDGRAPLEPGKDIAQRFGALDRVELVTSPHEAGNGRRVHVGAERHDQDVGKTSATRADLRFGYGPDGQLFLLNKQDEVIRLLVP